MELSQDYVVRSGHRLAAIEVLLQRQSYADVVRECQEVIELCLKAVLLKCHVEVPRVHDVSDILQKERARLPENIQSNLARICHISKGSRRDRELSFYGAADITPSQFYSQSDAETALNDAKWIYGLVS